MMMSQGNKPLMPMYIAVNDVGVHVITVDTKVPSVCSTCRLKIMSSFMLCCVFNNLLVGDIQVDSVIIIVEKN